MWNLKGTNLYNGTAGSRGLATWDGRLGCIMDTAGAMHWLGQRLHCGIQFPPFLRSKDLFWYNHAILAVQEIHYIKYHCTTIYISHIIYTIEFLVWERLHLYIQSPLPCIHSYHQRSEIQGMSMIVSCNASCLSRWFCFNAQNMLQVAHYMYFPWNIPDDGLFCIVSEQVT